MTETLIKRRNRGGGLCYNDQELMKIPRAELHDDDVQCKNRVRHESVPRHLM